MGWWRLDEYRHVVASLCDIILILAMPQQPSTTPILDLEAPLPNARDLSYTVRQKIVISAVFLAAVFGPVYAAHNIRQEPDGGWAGDFPFFLTLVFLGNLVLWALLTAAHELGHIIAGLAIGFRFQAVEVGPLRIERRRGCWQFGSVRPFRAFMGGNADMRLDRIFKMRQRLILLYLGGTAGTIPVALAAWSAVASSSSPIAFLVAMNFGTLSVIQLLIGIVRVDVGPQWEGANDFTFVRALSCSGQNAKRLLMSYAIHMVRAREVDEIQVNPRWLRAAYTKELWDEWAAYGSSEYSEEMANQLEKWLAESGKYREADRAAFILEAAFFMAWHRNDASKAQVWFERVGQAEDRETYRKIRAETALCCARGEFSVALEYWQRGAALLRSMPQPWVRTLEHEWSKWRSEIEARKTAYTAQIVAAST